MARTSSTAKDDTDADDTSAETAETGQVAAPAPSIPAVGQPAAEQAPLTTGQEPDPRGVHIPGREPGQFTDLGPVSIQSTPPGSS